MDTNRFYFYFIIKKNRVLAWKIYHDEDKSEENGEESNVTRYVRNTRWRTTKWQAIESMFFADKNLGSVIPVVIYGKWWKRERERERPASWNFPGTKFKGTAREVLEFLNKRCTLTMAARQLNSNEMPATPLQNVKNFLENRVEKRPRSCDIVWKIAIWRRKIRKIFVCSAISRT